MNLWFWSIIQMRSDSRKLIWDVGIVGGGVGGCEVARLASRINKTNGTALEIAIIDERSDLFEGTSAAMARRMGRGGHYFDEDSVSFYAFSFELTMDSFVADREVFKCDNRGELDLTYRKLKQQEQHVSSWARVVNSIYVVAKETAVSHSHLQDHHGAVWCEDPEILEYKQVDPERIQQTDDGKYCMFEGEHDGVLKLDYVVDCYKKFFKERTNISVLNKTWVHSFKEIQCEASRFGRNIQNVIEDFIQKITQERNPRYTEEQIEQFKGQLQSDKEWIDRHAIALNKKSFEPVEIEGIDNDSSTPRSRADTVDMHLAHEDTVPAYIEAVITVGFKNDADGNTIAFLNAFKHLHLAAYDGNSRLINRSGLVEEALFDDDAEQLELLEVKPSEDCPEVSQQRSACPDGEISYLRRCAKEDETSRYRSRRKMAVQLNSVVCELPITFIQGPFASMLRDYVTAELVTNLPTSQDEWGLVVHHALTAIYKDNIHQSKFKFFDTWLIILQETMLRNRTPVQEPLMSSSQEGAGSHSPAITMQLQSVRTNYAELNNKITEEICAIYFSLLLKYFYLLSKRDLFCPDFIPDEYRTAEFNSNPTARGKILHFIQELRDASIPSTPFHSMLRFFIDFTAASPSFAAVEVLKSVMQTILKDSQYPSSDYIRFIVSRYSQLIIHQDRLAHSSSIIDLESKDLSDRLKHFYESVMGIWILEAASCFMPVLKLSDTRFGTTSTDYIKFFAEYANHVFGADGSWLGFANLARTPFNIKQVLTGEVLRVKNSDDASSVIKLISSPRSSISKCREEKPWATKSTRVTGAVTKKFWHGTINAVKAICTMLGISYQNITARQASSESSSPLASPVKGCEAQKTFDSQGAFQAYKSFAELLRKGSVASTNLPDGFKCVNSSSLLPVIKNPPLSTCPSSAKAEVFELANSALSAN
ncbi:MAG: hypothetical protein FJ186_03335 [Gammaproteobacteria bacterium]|nr:hypothetical protein [Gammaproteobacteria bacterium]